MFMLCSAVRKGEKVGEGEGERKRGMETQCNIKILNDCENNECFEKEGRESNQNTITC